MIQYRDIKALSVMEARQVLKEHPEAEFHWFDNRGIWKREPGGKNHLVYKGNHVGWKGTVRRFVT